MRDRASRRRLPTRSPRSTAPGARLESRGCMFGRTRERDERPLSGARARVAPKLAAAADEIVFHKHLFSRIERVYAELSSPGLKALATRRDSADDADVWQFVREVRSSTTATSSDCRASIRTGGAIRRLSRPKCWLTKTPDGSRTRERPGRAATRLWSRREPLPKARAPGQMGDRQHTLERRSLPDVFFAPALARAGVATFKSRETTGRERYEGDIAAIATSAPNVARLLGFRATPIGGGRLDGG